METKEQILQRINSEIKNRLDKFDGLPDRVGAIGSTLDQRMSSNVELFLKEIKDISLISVTAAPFSLTILLSGLNISATLLAISFVLFMINVLFLNIGVWYINNEFLRSTSSQKLENITMDLSANDVVNNLLETDKRVNALSDFFKSENELNTKKKLEPYKQINTVDNIRFFGILLLSLAIISLITSVALPLLLSTI